MTDKILDTVAWIFFYGMFVTPLLTIPLAWKFFKIGKAYRIIIGLLLAAFLSFLFFCLFIEIGLRNGMGGF